MLEQDLKKRSLAAEEFDLYTKGPTSPSKLKKRFKPVVNAVATQVSGKFLEVKCWPQNTTRSS